MKKLGFICATMFLTFTMQAQNQHGNVSVHTYSNGHHNNHHQNYGNHNNSNNQWNNHQGNHHSNNGQLGNSHNNNYHNNYYGNNQHGNHNGHYPQHGNNHYPYPQPIICNIPPPIIIQEPIYYGPSAMENGAFQTLKATIDNQWFSSDQLSVFDQALANNFFTAQQVTELVQLFTFSSDQLKVAKKSYLKTVDPENYFMVNSALQYSSSVRELTAYIASI